MRVGRVVLAVTAGLLCVAPPAVPAAAATVREQQWWLDALAVPQAQRLSTGRDVVVAVVDTGVDAGQADLAGALVSGTGTNGVRSAKGWEDPDGHGTQMASVLAGRGGDGPNHVLGIAPAATVLPIAVPIGNRRTASGETSGTLADPIRYATDHGARIINLSFSLDSTEPIAAETDAIAYARAKGVILVAAGGNRPQGDTRVPLPGRYPGVLTVSGTNRDGTYWNGSLPDPAVDIAAPAQDIIGAAPKAAYPSGFAVGSGTSGATAIVSGTLALIWSRYPRLTADAVIDRLLRTARDLGRPGRDDEFGHGLVDPLAALTATYPAPSADELIVPDKAALVPPSAAPNAPRPNTDTARADGPARTRRVALVAGGAVALAAILFAAAVPLLRRRRPREAGRRLR